MAETGSASASGSGHNHIHSPTPAPVSSSSRIRFPPDDSAARSPLSSGESSHKPLPLGFRSSPVRRSSPLASHATSSFNGRRRGQPVDVAKGLLVEPPSPRTRKTPSANIGPAVYSSSMEGNSSSPSNLRAEVDVFSDEYDLCAQSLSLSLFLSDLKCSCISYIAHQGKLREYLMSYLSTNIFPFRPPNSSGCSARIEVQGSP